MVKVKLIKKDNKLPLVLTEIYCRYTCMLPRQERRKSSSEIHTYYTYQTIDFFGHLLEKQSTFQPSQAQIIDQHTILHIDVFNTQNSYSH